MFNSLWTLVVEDDAHSLIAISVILRELGIDFKRNTTGSGVVQQIEEMNPKPGFVLLNLSLPDGDPILIASEIRATSELSRIPVIAIGAEANTDLIHRLELAGFSGFIPKPLPRKKFPQLLRHILKGDKVWERSCD